MEVMTTDVHVEVEAVPAAGCWDKVKLTIVVRTHVLTVLGGMWLTGCRERRAVMLPDGVVVMLRVVRRDELRLLPLVLMERALVALVARCCGLEVLLRVAGLSVWWVEASLERWLLTWGQVVLRLVQTLRGPFSILLPLPGIEVFS